MDGAMKSSDTHLYIYILIEQIVVVMAGDDGDEQRTERTEQKGFATVTLALRPLQETQGI